MKSFVCLLTFVLLSVNAVFGAPKFNINQYDDLFHYWISNTTMTATIMGVKNLTTTKVTLNPYITVDGKNYYVNQIGAGAFSNSDVETIIVGNNIRSLKFGYNSFYNAKKIKTIILKTPNVIADDGAFNNLSIRVNFEGIGCRSLANDVSRKLLQKWKLPVGKNYKNVSTKEFNKDLYTLAYYVNMNFFVYKRIAYPDNAVTVLTLKGGNANGIARAYRILARNMGFEYNDVHVGGDEAGQFSWNYVYIVKDGTNKMWYNLDVLNTEFPSIDYNPNVFRTLEQQKSVLQRKYGSKDSEYLDTDNWIIYNNEYNYPGEFIFIEDQMYYFDSPRTETFNEWCTRNKSGARA